MKVNIGFTFYVTICYLAVIAAEPFVNEMCYDILLDYKNSGETENNTLTEKVIDASNNIVILKSGLSQFSSKAINKWLIASPALVVLCLVFVVQKLRKPGRARGLMILSSFTIPCILVNSMIRRQSGLGYYPAVSVLLISFFYGALFWFIDGFCKKEEFDSIITSIENEASKNKTEKLKLIYDITKNLISMVVTLFLGVCIAMVFNISSIVKEQYAVKELASVIIGWTIWLTFWGSLGLLGWIGAELGGQLKQIKKAMKE